MRRTLAFLFTALVAIALFVGLVYAVLMAAHASEPAAITIYGVTPRRLWATMSAALSLVGAVIGAAALTRPTGRFRSGSGRRGAIVAGAIGLIGTVNGTLNLAVATGGPGTGNGVVGGAAAIVLGVTAVALGAVALIRGRRIPVASER